jgi:hypothetical protein
MALSLYSGSTTAAVANMNATVANINASIAAEEAEKAAKAAAEAKVNSCHVLMRGYVNDGSTVQSIQAYSACVDLIYPKPVEPKVITGFDMFVYLVFAAVVFVSSVRGFRTGFMGEDVPAGLVGGIVGFIGGAAVGGLVALVISLLLIPFGGPFA